MDDCVYRSLYFIGRDSNHRLVDDGEFSPAEFRCGYFHDAAQLGNERDLCGGLIDGRLGGRRDSQVIRLPSAFQAGMS